MRAQIAGRVKEMLEDLGQRVSASTAGVKEKALLADAAYADALFREGVDPKSQMGHAFPIANINTVVGDYEAAGGIGPRTAMEARAARVMDNSLLAANIASRYALPAGGVTLAGKGLMDIAAGLSPEEEEELMIRYSQSS